MGCVIALELLAPLLRKFPSRLVYGIWCLLLLRLCVPFYFEMEMQKEQSSVPIAAERVEVRLEHVSAAGSHPQEFSSEQPPERKREPARSSLFTVWISVTVALACILIFKYFRLRREMADADIVERDDVLAKFDECCNRAEIRIRVRLVAMDCGPALFGLLQPTIVLPRHIARKWHKFSYNAPNHTTSNEIRTC